jgi:hypothetical protein
MPPSCSNSVLANDYPITRVLSFVFWWKPNFTISSYSLSSGKMSINSLTVEIVLRISGRVGTKVKFGPWRCSGIVNRTVLLYTRIL